MANKDAAFGLKAIGKVGQNRDNQGLSGYGIAASSTAIYQNDPIMMAATGKIVVGTAAAVLLGSLNGVFFTDATTSKPTWSNYWPGNAATDAVAFIYDSPMDVFEVQADAAFPVADLFGNFDLVDNSGTGSTSSGISYVELDVTTGATTATLPFKALDISQDPENSDVSTANTNVLVTIQNHLFGAKAVGLA